MFTTRDERSKMLKDVLEGKEENRKIEEMEKGKLKEKPRAKQSDKKNALEAAINKKRKALFDANSTDDSKRRK